jgi:4-hydroxy-tetrahydrodipicolinate reductase
MRIVVNGSKGKVLMQKFARVAARYFESAEIIDYHHETKVDHPSATALRTAELMAEVRSDFTATRTTRSRASTGPVAASSQASGFTRSACQDSWHRRRCCSAGPASTSPCATTASTARATARCAMAAKYIVDRAELVYGLEQILVS